MARRHAFMKQKITEALTLDDMVRLEFKFETLKDAARARSEFYAWRQRACAPLEALELSASIKENEDGSFTLVISGGE